MDCKHLIDDKCMIIYSLSGKEYHPTPRDCEICSQIKDPQSENCFTLMIANDIQRENNTQTDESVHRYTTQCGNEKSENLKEAIIKVDGEPLQKPLEPPSPPEGPGTELTKLLSWFAKDTKGCKCKSRARKMNIWGPDRCEQEMETIVGWLQEEGEKRGWPTGRITSIVSRKLVGRAIANSRKGIRVGRIERDTRYHISITTAPRPEPTVQTCVDHFRRCGWEPTLYAEPESEDIDVDTIQNPKKLGVWHNFLSSVDHALESEAEYIITAQDDVDLHPDTKKFVDWAIENHPEYFDGFLSLYTPKHYSVHRGKIRDVGVYAVPTKSLWGACCLVWKRDVLQKVADHRYRTDWLGATLRSKKGRKIIMERRRNDPSLVANSDTAIGKILRSYDLPMRFVDPSPASHIAKYSSFSHGGNTGRRNCWRCADHNRPLMEQLEL